MPEPVDMATRDPTPRDITVMGFDFGMKRIGVAIGNGITGTAQPLIVLPAQDGVPDWAHVAALVAEWKPSRFIVGLPLNMDGEESEMSALARRFSRKLAGRIPLVVDLVDERLSSIEAGSTMRDLAIEKGRPSGFRRGTTPIDAHAAALIVESWFAQRAAGG